MSKLPSEAAHALRSIAELHCVKAFALSVVEASASSGEVQGNIPLETFEYSVDAASAALERAETHPLTRGLTLAQRASLSAMIARCGFAA